MFFFFNLQYLFWLLTSKDVDAGLFLSHTHTERLKLLTAGVDPSKPFRNIKGRTLFLDGSLLCNYLTCFVTLNTNRPPQNILQRHKALNSSRPESVAQKAFGPLVSVHKLRRWKQTNKKKKTTNRLFILFHERFQTLIVYIINKNLNT